MRYGRYVSRKPSYAGFVEEMRALATRHPAWSVKDEGEVPGTHQMEGQEAPYRVFSLNLGDLSKPLFFFYIYHGGEWHNMYGLLRLAELLATQEIPIDLGRFAVKIVPMGNPWGLDQHTNQSRLGRYFDWINDQPEDQVLRAIVGSHTIHCGVELHGNDGYGIEVVLQPKTARPDNADLACRVKDLFNQRIADRFIFRKRLDDGPGQYRIRSVFAPEPPAGGTHTLDFVSRNAYGFLTETYCSGETVRPYQSEITVEICRAALEAYGAS